MPAGKSEKPTHQRLRQLRKKGQVAQSREVVSAVLTMGFFALFVTSLPRLVDRLEAAILLPIAHLKNENFVVVALQLFGSYGREIQSLTMPFLGVVLIGGAGAHVLQTGVLFSPSAAAPSLMRLNPSENISRIFSWQSLFELSRSVVKVLLLGLVLLFVIRAAVSSLVWIPSCGISCLALLTGNLLFYVAVWAGAIHLVVAMADFAFQRWQFEKKNMMSLEEVKREYKENEGDPLIKRRRKQLRSQLMAKNPIALARNATVLVSNPTHVAVAVYYDGQQTPLPVIDAIGTDLVAQQMIAAATAAGVPVMRNVPLARALLEDGLVDEYIPSHLIEPIAEVLRALGDLATETGGGRL
ncbi:MULTISPECIES: EscU/YscU/HrcU family type III secretion system export apparatus switch protein [Bradyrhizobium]|uniref:EscU/YscU/HrcU family type III secretion system export apparatus switch protein n=1 Tax=Bradyrhizobium septentrionale TaxID=1404411 RepID=A0A974A5G8_9BRAD|nr:MULTISPECIES: EscU/YscU/HrcU family type III secretion system export apparatus switch protein [Bradyrhizobium]MCK7664783.1 EscU/YscU/HrcU family type III secretion system export apparatus switch protein [Bradyrhizobium sp. 2S1]UGY30262.1 EscU/YscU/HrcU family type III secretion system export apparatus switch protein [Bradyrhizobium septentrionale]